MDHGHGHILSISQARLHSFIEVFQQFTGTNDTLYYTGIRVVYCYQQVVASEPLYGVLELCEAVHYLIEASLHVH